MVQRYTTIALRVLFAASMIAASAQVHAGAHGAMAKRHNMTCKQLLVAALFGAAAVNGDMNCVFVYGHSQEKGHFNIETPICKDNVGSTPYGEYYVAGLVDGVAAHSLRSVVSLKSAPCVLKKSYSKMRVEEESCLDILHLEKSDIRYEDRQYQTPQIAPAQ